jgi:hypothetical protein
MLTIDAGGSAAHDPIAAALRAAQIVFGEWKDDLPLGAPADRVAPEAAILEDRARCLQPFRLA